MEWLKKILEGLGLNAEQIKTITEGVESNYRGYVPEHRFKEVLEARKQAEETVKERDKQLKDIGEKAKGNEELTKQIGDLQAANKAATEKHNADMAELKTNTALKLALAAQVHDPDIVLGLLDKSKIELDDNGNVKAGLDDQVKSLRESKAFLFVEKQDKGTTFKGFKPAESREQREKGDDQGEFGKKLAEAAAKGNDGLTTARDSYFK